MKPETFFNICTTVGDFHGLIVEYHHLDNGDWPVLEMIECKICKYNDDKLRQAFFGVRSIIAITPAGLARTPIRDGYRRLEVVTEDLTRHPNEFEREVNAGAAGADGGEKFVPYGFFGKEGDAE